jgi:hypothetical protein
MNLDIDSKQRKQSSSPHCEASYRPRNTFLAHIEPMILLVLYRVHRIYTEVPESQWQDKWIELQLRPLMYHL